MTPAFPKGSAPAACVDISGTKVAVSIADEHRVRGRVAEPTIKQGNPNALAQQALALIEQSCARAGVMMSDISVVGGRLLRAICHRSGFDPTRRPEYLWRYGWPGTWPAQ